MPRVSEQGAKSRERKAVISYHESCIKHSATTDNGQRTKDQIFCS